MATELGQGHGLDNRYAGWRLSSPAHNTAGVISTIAKVDVATLDGETFYREFVAQRRPVLLRGHLSDTKFHEWTFPFLRERAGDRVVEVEVSRGRAPRGPLTRVSNLRNRLEKNTFCLTCVPLPDAHV